MTVTTGSDEQSVELTDEQKEAQRTGMAAARSGPNRMASAGMPAESAKDLGGSTKRLIGLMRPYRAVAIIAIALAFVAVSMNVVGPKVLGHATDIVFNGLKSPAGINFDDLHRVLLTVVGIYVVAGVLAYLQNYLIAGVVQRTMRDLRSSVELKLTKLPLRYVDGQPRGDMLSRVTNDIDNLAQSLQQTLGQMLTSVLMLIGVMIMMLTISPLLALISVIMIPASLTVLKVVAGRSKKKFISQWMHTGALNAQVEEAFTGHSLVKVFGQSHDVTETFRTENEKLFQASFGAQFISGTIMPLMMFLGNLNFVAIAVIGGFKVASGTMSLGDVQAFIQYSRQFTQPLTQVASMANVFQSGIASAERVFELLDAPEESDDSAMVAHPETARGRVVFDHVHFSYNPDKPLIEDLSLIAEPGETVAIVGPTGAGKTTLVNLIMRFYEIQGGAISIDGNDIAQMRRRDLRKDIGMVLQDTWLFEGTIHDNIAFGNPDASDEKILEAAKATYVDRFVHSLPDGYDTIVDDEGGHVSAGEKQLLTIARAFLADPAILILDEATSSVDTRTEVLIQEAMNALRSNRTSFVIAHRLSTIRDADTILVMDGGAIVEQGSHEELLAAGGAYFNLYNAQFAGAAAEVD